MIGCQTITAAGFPLNRITLPFVRRKGCAIWSTVNFFCREDKDVRDRGGVGGKVPERGKGGKPPSLLSGGPGRQRYHCDVCNILQISYDLKHHYSSKTEWKKLDRLQNGVKLEVVVNEMGDIDPHTRYMWENKNN